MAPMIKARHRNGIRGGIFSFSPLIAGESSSGPKPRIWFQSDGDGTFFGDFNDRKTNAGTPKGNQLDYQ